MQPKHNISANRAADILMDGKPLIDVYVEGELKIESIDIWDKEVIFENCILDFFSGILTPFNKPVRLINCHFKKCHFSFSYFLGGLIIDNCTFESYLDFQAGGHNRKGNPVIITNNEFKDFVNFFDCWYEDEVIISNNIFHKGTNLLGKPHSTPVTFNIKAIIKDNIGQIDFDNEGEVSK